MAVTPINSEDRLVQATFADHLEKVLGWESVYAWNDETFGSDGTLGRADTQEVVLKRDLCAALVRLNPGLPTPAIEEAFRTLTEYDANRSLLQHNEDFYRMLRGGVSVQYRDADGRHRDGRARVIDFDNKPGANCFPRGAGTEAPRGADAELQQAGGPRVFCQRVAARLH